MLERIQNDLFVDMADVNGYYAWMRDHNRKRKDLVALMATTEDANVKLEQEQLLRDLDAEVPSQFIPPVDTHDDGNNKSASTLYNPINPTHTSYNPTLVLDCDHEHMMQPSEVYSLVKQLAHCYGSNCRARAPMKMAVSGVAEGTITDVQLSKYSGSDAWVWLKDPHKLVDMLKKPGMEKEDAEAREAWEKEKKIWEEKNPVKIAKKKVSQPVSAGDQESTETVTETQESGSASEEACAEAASTCPELVLPSLAHVVYLTAESNNVIDNIEDDKCYVVGGIVDHNRLKGYAHGCATSYGMKTAR